VSSTFRIMMLRRLGSRYLLPRYRVSLSLYKVLIYQFFFRQLQQGFRKVQSTGRELDGLDVVGDGGRDFSPASINKLKDKTARVPAGSLGERYVRPSNDYGDGSELDAIEDFPGSVPTQLKPTTPSSHRRSKVPRGKTEAITKKKSSNNVSRCSTTDRTKAPH